MPVEIRVPPLGESLVDAVVGQWLKGEGDQVSRGETIVELETDKVNLDVTAPEDGVLGKIERNEGDVVSVVELLGTVAEGSALSDGYFHRPAIVTNIPDAADLVQQEQFGPVLPILAYDDLEDALARANATEYGLCGSVWSPDVDRAFDVARRIQAGQAFVNCHGGAALDPECPTGGIKQSGMGREMGVEGFKGFLEGHYVTNRMVR